MKKILTLLLLVASIVHLYANEVIEQGPWRITYLSTSRIIRVQCSANGAQKTIFSGSIPEATYDNPQGKPRTVTIKNFSEVELLTQDVEDEFGKGVRSTLRFTGCNNGDDVSMLLHYTTYPKVDYMLVSMELQSPQTIKSNMLAPVNNSVSYSIFTASQSNRMLKVPFDNDGFCRYGRMRLNTSITSYEVTAIYDAKNRNGLVIGSVDHDHWKSAIRITAVDDSKISKIEVVSGVAETGTRDVIPHGKLEGESISSARFMVGYFSDWRDGMETYAKACTTVVPKRDNWPYGRPVGWMSWNVLEKGNNRTDDSEIMKFISSTLRPIGFHNGENRNLISIDSWSNLSTQDEKVLVAQADTSMQVMGCYGYPFALWWGENDLDNIYYQSSTKTYKARDVVLKANGKPLSNDGAFCLDPTHPAVRAMMSSWVRQQYSKGYRAFKLDFVTNGIFEADSFYDKTIHTGVEAYNQGFKYFVDRVNQLKEPVFILISIGPLFPYQYGNARRQACDTWGTIGWTEYCMNAITAGWWTDGLYQFNDPDGIPLVGEGGEGNTTLAENRARLTSGIVSGVMQLADNFSLVNKSGRGNPELSRQRAQELLGNPDINEMLALEKSFRPIYGTGEYNNGAEGAENKVYYRTDKYLYVAVFNYNNSLTSTPVRGKIMLEDLGIGHDEFSRVKELWSGQDVEVGDWLSYDVKPRDACLFRFTLKEDQTAIWLPKGEAKLLQMGQNLQLKSERFISRLRISNLQGLQMASMPVEDYTANLSQLPYRGVTLVTLEYADGSSETIKAIL